MLVIQFTPKIWKTGPRSCPIRPRTNTKSIHNFKIFSSARQINKYLTSAKAQPPLAVTKIKRPWQSSLTLTSASLRHAIDPRGSRFTAEHLQSRRTTWSTELRLRHATADSSGSCLSIWLVVQLRKQKHHNNTDLRSHQSDDMGRYS